MYSIKHEIFKGNFQNYFKDVGTNPLYLSIFDLRILEQLLQLTFQVPM